MSQLVTLVHGLMGLTRQETEDYYAHHDIESISGKKFCKLEKNQKIDLLLSFLTIKKRNLYLIDHITREMPIESYLRLKDVMEELSGSGCMVVYLTRDRLLSIPPSPGKEPGDMDYSELDRWSEVVESQLPDPIFFLNSFSMIVSTH